MSSDLDDWQQDVASFVLDHLPSPPRRVLDVGCGDGWLVRVLDDHGYDATGIDPEAPDDDPRLTRSRLEHFEADAWFDAVVAVLSLHHVTDLDLAIDAIIRLLRRPGLVVCVEFAWDRFDDETARWCLEHLPVALDDDNWLHELSQPLRQRQLQREPLRASELIGSWASAHGFHTSEEMIAGLTSRFEEQRLEWGPYLYPDLDIEARTERAAIERGRIAAVSFRFVGR